VQGLRKEFDLELTDRIHVVYDCDDDLAAAIEAHRDYIASEVLAESIERGAAAQSFDINGERCGIAIERV